MIWRHEINWILIDFYRCYFLSIMSYMSCHLKKKVLPMQKVSKTQIKICIIFLPILQIFYKYFTKMIFCTCPLWKCLCFRWNDQISHRKKCKTFNVQLWYPSAFQQPLVKIFSFYGHFPRNSSHLKQLLSMATNTFVNVEWVFIQFKKVNCFYKIYKFNTQKNSLSLLIWIKNVTMRFHVRFTIKHS